MFRYLKVALAQVRHPQVLAHQVHHPRRVQVLPQVLVTQVVVVLLVHHLLVVTQALHLVHPHPQAVLLRVVALPHLQVLAQAAQAVLVLVQIQAAQLLLVRVLVAVQAPPQAVLPQVRVRVARHLAAALVRLLRVALLPVQHLYLKVVVQAVPLVPVHRNQVPQAQVVLVLVILVRQVQVL